MEDHCKTESSLQDFVKHGGEWLKSTRNIYLVGCDNLNNSGPGQPGHQRIRSGGRTTTGSWSRNPKGIFLFTIKFCNRTSSDIPSGRYLSPCWRWRMSSAEGLAFKKIVQEGEISPFTIRSVNSASTSTIVEVRELPLGRKSVAPTGNIAEGHR